VRASVTLVCGVVRLSFPPSHQASPAGRPSPPHDAVPNPSFPLAAGAVPEPAPRGGASGPVADGARPVPGTPADPQAAPETGHPFAAPPFVGAPELPGVPGLFGAPGRLAAPCAPCAPGPSGNGPAPEPGPGAEPELPELPVEPECGWSKSSPVTSSDDGPSAEFVGFVGCGGTGARRASVLMHPPVSSYPGHRLSVCGPVFSCPCSYTDRRPPRPHLARTQIQSRPGHAYPQRRTAIPGAVERPAAFPPCVRVTLRVDAARTGTSPHPRGICPERPPTLR
jgi:hypothetical protein